MDLGTIHLGIEKYKEGKNNYDEEFIHAKKGRHRS